MYFYCYDYVFLFYVYIWLHWLRVFPCFFLSCKANSRVKNPQRRGTAPTLPNCCVVPCLLLFCSMYFCVVLCIVCFVSFSVLFVCICVLYCCHRMATQLQLNISYHNTYKIICGLHFSINFKLLVFTCFCGVASIVRDESLRMWKETAEICFKLQFQQLPEKNISVYGVTTATLEGTGTGVRKYYLPNTRKWRKKGRLTIIISKKFEIRWWIKYVWGMKRNRYVMKSGHF